MQTVNFSTIEDFYAFQDRLPRRVIEQSSLVASGGSYDFQYDDGYATIVSDALSGVDQSDFLDDLWAQVGGGGYGQPTLTWNGAARRLTFTDSTGAATALPMDETGPSADAGNLISEGSDGGAILTQADVRSAETTTSLTYNAATYTLTFTDEDGATTALDLSALTTDVYVGGGSINGSGQLVLTDNDPGTPDVVIDLSAYINSVTDNQVAGTVTLASAGGSTTVQKTAWMSAGLVP